MENKEESKKELTEEYGGLGKSVFICKKEDFERNPGQPYINEEGNLVTFVGQGENKMEWEHREELMPDIWHEVSLVDDSYIFPSVFVGSVDGFSKIDGVYHKYRTEFP